MYDQQLVFGLVLSLQSHKWVRIRTLANQNIGEQGGGATSGTVQEEILA